MKKQDTAAQISEILNSFSTKEKIEIIANVLILEGVSLIDTPSVIDKITTANITEIVLNDRKTNGETMANSMALQGLTMLLWCENK